MRDLGLGWTTDVAVLALSGSEVEDRGDHVVIRTPANPTYNWGNCILVTDPDAVDDADRWVRVFDAAFPAATWVAIGLSRMPSDPAPWTASALDLEVDDVLVASSRPPRTPTPAGYAVRRLAGDDWQQQVALTVAENARTGSWDADTYATFARARTDAVRGLSERGSGACFGAFADGRLVASLGVVRCDTTCRYQNVLTDVGHRRRGLASHLLGEAAQWAARDCDRWVIVTETTNPAKRIYERAGFAAHTTNVQAYGRRQ
jgi:GNAT superfamily N-acetyltransferase